MPVNPPKRRRQATPPAIPAASGITGAATISPSATGTILQTDPGGDTIAPLSAPALATGITTTIGTPATSVTSDASASTSAVTSTKSSSSNISVGTALAACIGTVAGVIVLVLFAFFSYRRYTSNLKSQALAASEKRAARAKGNNDRSKKRSMENWNKMEEVGEGGKIQTKQIRVPTGMEQMTMFQKSPSVRSPLAESVTEENSAGPFDHSFPRFNPTKNLAESPTASQRQFMGRSDSEHAPPMSWDRETVGTNPFLSLRSTDIERPSENTLSKAIPTPPAVEHELHRWESAEVLHFDADPKEKRKAEDKKDGVSLKSIKSNKSSKSSKSNKGPNPFATEAKNFNNPFFNAQDFGSGSSGGTPPPSTPLSLKAQGKQRALDPFIDDNASPTMSVPHMPFAKHTATDSNVSHNSDRAIQSLINVLDMSEEDVQERLRIASMQPSFVSASSYQDGEPDSSVFPLPPP